MKIYEEFAGPGGWDEGLSLLHTDAEIVAAVDSSLDACTTARRAGHTRLHEDVRNVDLSDAAEAHGHISSPPCQTFSTLGTGKGRASIAALAHASELVLAGHSIEYALRREALEERTALVLRPLVVANVIRPEWIALEQVPNVQKLWNVFADLLRRIGYHVATGVLSAERYGVPQVRRRAVLLAHLRRNVSLPMPTHSEYHRTAPRRLDAGVLPWVTMAQALGDHWQPIFNDQSGTSYNPLWPFERPATAVAGRGLIQNPGATANRFNGSTKSRNDGVKITVPEAALLQTFRPDYPFTGTLRSQFQQVGDAMPPLLAAAVLGQLLPRSAHGRS